MHCTFARSFNEHPNSLSLLTLICNTFIEGYQISCRTSFFVVEMIYYLFFLYSILGQQLSFKRKHHGVVTIHGPWSRISKTSHLKLKHEVSRTAKKKIQDCDYVFGSSTTFQRRKEWICESRCRQVSVRLHVFAGFFCP